MRIGTGRLALIALPAEALGAIAEGRMDLAGARAGCDLSGFPAEEREIARIRLADLALDPEYLPWSLRAICLKPELRCVGHFNFHSRPDPAYLRDLAPGAVELGYYILPEFRRRGLAEEAARAMMDWAADSPWRPALRGLHQPRQRRLGGHGAQAGLRPDRRPSGRGRRL